MKLELVGAVFALTMVVGAAQASTIVVTPPSGTPSATSWGVLPGEQSAGSSIGITGTAPRSGNGSIEMIGDRTRFQLGIQYATGRTDLMALSAVTGLAFDWRIAADATAGYNPDETPALRLLVQDGIQRSELIWEGAYNGTYGNTTRDTWYSSTFNDNFYQYQAGQGVTLSGGAQVNKTLSQWIASNYDSSAYVSGVSVGDGSGFSPGYHAFADNVTLGTTGGNTTYNFELASPGVPEPATWGLMVMGFGGLGAILRRRRGSIALAA